MANLKAVLHTFNNEELIDYVDRAYDIVTGIATENQLCKSVVRICLSHFMHRISKRCKEICGKKMSHFYLRIVSLLSNCKTLNEAEEIIFDTAVILSSKNLSDVFVVSNNRIIKKINNFTTSVCNEDSNNILHECETHSPTKIHHGKLEEGEFISRLANSKFDKWAKQIINIGRMKVSSLNLQDDKPINKYYKPEFLSLLEKQYLPNMPIWSDLLMGNLKRHAASYVGMKLPFDSVPAYSDFRSVKDTVKVTAIAEARFNVLKNIDLNGQSKHRLDDFIGLLCESWKGIHRTVGESLLKTKKLRQMPKSKQVRLKPKSDLKEEWNKRKKEPNHLRKKQRHFSTKT